MNIGIIGLGAFAEYHIRAIEQLQGLEITAVSRRDKEALDLCCRQYGFTGYTDYRDLLDDKGIDAVLISTPHHMHTEIVEAAASMGKHILLEKPLAENPEGVARIQRAVQESGIFFMAGYSNHYTKANKRAKEIIDSGEIGEIVTGMSFVHKYWMVPERRQWHLNKSTGGGMWLTIGVHLIDRLTFFINSRVSSISAKIGTRFHDQEADDWSSAYLKYENNAVGFVSAVGHCAGGLLEQTVLTGTKGSLKINQKDGLFLGRDELWVPVEGTSTEDQHQDALTEEWRAFSSYVQNGYSADVVPLHFAVEVMDVVFAGQLSAKENREVRIDTKTAGTPGGQA